MIDTPTGQSHEKSFLENAFRVVMQTGPLSIKRIAMLGGEMPNADEPGIRKTPLSHEHG
jgi:hypothetical protein